MRDCKDCYELWDEILFYKSLIGTNSRWLFDNRTEVQNRKDEIVDLQSKLPKAGSADKVFYSREIDRHTVRIAETEALNRDLEELIRKEWAILKDRIAQYADCVKRHCPVPVAAAPEPPTAPVTGNPPSSPTPGTSEKAGSDSGWKTTTGLNFPTIPKGLDYPGPVPGSSPPEEDPLEPPKASFVPPSDGRKICGPDITKAVIETLRKIRKGLQRQRREADRGLPLPD